MLLHFDHDLDGLTGVGSAGDFKGVVDLGKMLARKLDVEHRSDDLDDLSNVGGSCCRHNQDSGYGVSKRTL